MELELTRLFVKVVQHGSYTKASEILKIPKSTISKAITRLELNTGTQLLIRTTRSQTLTAAGRVFYETCLGPLQVLEDAQKSLYGQDSIISGNIKLTAPEDLGFQIVAPLIAKLSRDHKRLSFELYYTNQIIDLVKEGYDLAVRIGRLTESNLKVKKIGYLNLIPVAAPGFLAGEAKIRAPKDLELLECLSLSGNSSLSKWPLQSKNEKVQVAVKSRIQCNQMTSLLQIVLAGAGVGLIPAYLCKDSIDTGKLIRVLPEWSCEGLPISIVSPLTMNSSARLKMVSDSLLIEIRRML